MKSESCSEILETGRTHSKHKEVSNWVGRTIVSTRAMFRHIFKTAVIVVCPRPKTKKSKRQFLELA